MCLITPSDPHKSKGAPSQEEMSQSVTAIWRRETLNVDKTHAHIYIQEIYIYISNAHI